MSYKMGSDRKKNLFEPSRASTMDRTTLNKRNSLGESAMDFFNEDFDIHNAKNPDFSKHLEFSKIKDDSLEDLASMNNFNYLFDTS